MPVYLVYLSLLLGFQISSCFETVETALIKGDLGISGMLDLGYPPQLSSRSIQSLRSDARTSLEVSRGMQTVTSFLWFLLDQWTNGLGILLISGSYGPRDFRPMVRICHKTSAWMWTLFWHLWKRKQILVMHPHQNEGCLGDLGGGTIGHQRLKQRILLKAVERDIICSLFDTFSRTFQLLVLLGLRDDWYPFETRTLTLIAGAWCDHPGDLDGRHALSVIFGDQISFQGTVFWKPSSWMDHPLDQSFKPIHWCSSSVGSPASSNFMESDGIYGISMNSSWLT